MKVIKPEELTDSYELTEDNIYFQSALELFNSLVANQVFHYTSSSDVKIINIGKYHWSYSIVKKIVSSYRDAGWNVSTDGGYCAEGPFDAIKLSRIPGFIRGNCIYKDEAEWRVEYEKRLNEPFPKITPKQNEVGRSSFLRHLLFWKLTK